MFNRSRLFSLIMILAFVFVTAGIAQQQTDETVTCPVSGKVMKKSEAKISAEYQGKMYYFCCEGCKTNFLKDPEKYLQKQPEMKPLYSCPMHPEVTSDKPGKCPKYGMDLRIMHRGMGMGRPMMPPHGRGMMMQEGGFLASKDVEISVEYTPDGAVIKLSSRNPDMVKIIQGHAAMMKIMREKSQAAQKEGEPKKEEIKK